MTPFQMRILLHYYACPTPYEGSQRNSPIYGDTIADFVEAGLLEPLDGDYVGTERLYVYAQALIEVPLPVQRWVIAG